MEKESFVISRTSFCPECFAKGRPHKGNIFVVYRTNHGELRVKTNHQDGICGYTPFLYSWEEPYETKQGMIQLARSCAVHGCGVYIENPYAEQATINFVKTEFIWLPHNEFVALRDIWKNTGYELF